MDLINLRSDTVTLPTPDMRSAISSAELGDDYYRADPTVMKLEERSAELLGKESAMLVLSGTMGNLVSLLTLTERGQSIIVGDQSHILLNEGGNIATVGGVTLRTLPSTRGVFDENQLRAAILPAGNVLFAPTSVICLENTHALSGGRCLTKQYTESIAAIAAQTGTRIHMDGARIFNASVALGVSASELVACVDTVTFCLSKGLGCPAGSLIAGQKEVIGEARRWRQMIGGGMRQAGIIAAAGLVALDTMVDRLAVDHANARALASVLADMQLPIDVHAVETNILFLELPGSSDAHRRFVTELAEGGVIINPIRGGRARFVTHCDVTRDDVVKAAAVIAKSYQNCFAESRIRSN